MVIERGKHQLFRFVNKILSKVKRVQKLTSALVTLDVYSNWKIVIQLFLRIESYVVSNLRVPADLLFQLVELSPKVGSQQIVKMTLTLDQNLLYWALMHEVENTVEILLKNGANVNLINNDDDGYVPIHLAASRGNLDSIKLMKSYGVDINASGPGGWKAIHHAVSGQFVEVVQYLLVNGAEVNPRDVEQKMPIHIAAANGCTKIIELLISHGANIVAKGCNGWLPLHYATCNKHIQAVQLLVENGSDYSTENDEGFAPIDFAIIYGSVSIFKLLVKKGVKVRQDSILMAIEEHCVDMIQPLTEYGLDVNEKIGPFGNTAFREAIKCGCEICVEAMKECIRFGANPYIKDNEGKTSIENALFNRRLNIFKLLSQT